MLMLPVTHDITQGRSPVCLYWYVLCSRDSTYLWSLLKHYFKVYHSVRCQASKFIHLTMLNILHRRNCVSVGQHNQITVHCITDLEFIL